MGNFSIKKRRQDVILWEKVERLQKMFGLTNISMAILLSLSDSQYKNCRKKGSVLAFRYFGAKEALANQLHEEIFEIMEKIKKLDE